MPSLWEVQPLPWQMHRGSLLNAALDDGWEPFGVTEVSHQGATIWLRRLRPPPPVDQPPLIP
jgi:hypothetical protein